VHDRYGMPDVLRIVDVPAPSPGPGQVLVEVRATSVNLSDWEFLRGRPAYARFGGLTRPRRRILGSDIAGVVAAVGEGVTSFAVGDEVYGDNLALRGGFAELAVVPETALAVKPPELSFVEASALPQSGAIALQAVALAAPGDRVLINGAGGGTGTLAIQLAVRAGMRVTGVDSAAKLGLIRSLGAEHAIDYRAEDFTRTGPYDLVVDLVAYGRSVRDCRRALAQDGRYVVAGGSARTVLRIVTVGAALGALTHAHLGLLAVKQGPRHFASLADLCVAGEVRCLVDRVFSLDEVPDALAYVGAGRALGKAVVAVAP